MVLFLFITIIFISNSESVEIQKSSNLISNTIIAQISIQNTTKKPKIPISNSILGSVIIEKKPESNIGNGWCTGLVKYYRDVPWYGNARDWWQSAIDAEYDVGQEPRLNAIMVEKTKYIYGHVALVVDVDEDNFTILEQNVGGRGVVSQRILPLDHPAIGFIY